MSKQLTLNDILKMFLAHIKLIVILAIVGAIAAFGYVNIFVDEIYSTKALLLVQNESGEEGSSTLDSQVEEKVNINDISDSVKLANTCTILFTTDPDMTELFAGCNVNITPIEESYFLEVVVSSNEPDRAANVANQVVQKAPEVFGKYFSAGKVDTVYEAQIPGSPSSPDVAQYVIMGFLFGLILALGIAFLIEIVDTTIKSDDDLYAMYEIPVFAEIVDFEVEGGAKKK